MAVGEDRQVAFCFLHIVIAGIIDRGYENSGDLNNGLVPYSNGHKMPHHQMLDIQTTI